MLLFALTSMLGAPSFETLPASLSASTAKGWEEVIREIDTPPHGSVSGRDSRLKNASLAEASLGLSRLHKRSGLTGGAEALARAGTTSGDLCRWIGTGVPKGRTKAEPREGDVITGA